jgi:hypothetical protein
MAQPDDGRSYLVECYWPGINEERLAAATSRIVTVMGELRRVGARVAFQGSILMSGDETVFCRFNGDEEDIRVVCQRAEIPIERITESRWRDREPSDARPERDR